MVINTNLKKIGAVYKLMAKSENTQENAEHSGYLSCLSHHIHTPYFVI